MCARVHELEYHTLTHKYAYYVVMVSVNFILLFRFQLVVYIYSLAHFEQSRLICSFTMITILCFALVFCVIHTQMLKHTQIIPFVSPTYVVSSVGCILFLLGKEISTVAAVSVVDIVVGAVAVVDAST